jgi:hypothetical protein
MKNTEDFKTFWWFVLVVVIGFFLFGRQGDLGTSEKVRPTAAQLVSAIETR